MKDNLRGMHGSPCPLERGEVELLLDYASERIHPADAARVEAHLSSCQECSRLVEVQKTVWSALESWEAAPVSPDFNRRLYARIAQNEAARGPISKWIGAFAARWSPFNWRPVVPVAAVCATLVIALLIQNPHREHIRSVAPDAQMRVEKLDIDQVERALEDLEILNKLSDSGNRSAI